MSKRLQVLMPDREMAEIKRSARTEGVSVGEWVRRNLRDARNRKPGKGVESKLAVIRRGAEFAFPTAGIYQMNEEIERGYLG